MKMVIFLLTILFLSGCDNVKGELRSYVKNTHFCSIDTAQNRADFILQCIKNANPKSDEEPEDWIRKCQLMAEETLCEVKPVKVTEECASGTFWSCHWWRERNRSLAVSS